MKQGIKTAIAASAMYLAVYSAMPLATSFAETANTAASPSCGLHDRITSTLATQYNEVPYHRGLTPQGAMIEIFVSKARTFTVVVTIQTGMSCLVTAGTNWMDVGTISYSFDKKLSGDIEREH
ncbi:MAG: hypothetical protein COA52_03200 [Hyphomicrobiales bacterium]|nr:MAG: hypothetical protein COA52_03200 [Hyphomicrobiales bacterium]